MGHEFSLDHLWQQLKAFRAGDSRGLLLQAQLSPEDRRELERAERILAAMTEDERKNPDLLLDAAVRQRIAADSGTELVQVGELISQAAKIRMMLRRIVAMAL